MESLSWSSSSINDHTPNATSPEPSERASVNNLRNAALFHSYRNLLQNVGPYDSRISLHSKGPNTGPIAGAAGAASNRSQFPSSELAPFFFERSSSMRNLRPNYSTSLHNLLSENPNVPRVPGGGLNEMHSSVAIDIPERPAGMHREPPPTTSGASGALTNLMSSSASPPSGRINYLAHRFRHSQEQFNNQPDQDIFFSRVPMDYPRSPYSTNNTTNTTTTTSTRQPSNSSLHDSPNAEHLLGTSHVRRRPSGSRSNRLTHIRNSVPGCMRPITHGIGPNTARNQYGSRSSGMGDSPRSGGLNVSPSVHPNIGHYRHRPPRIDHSPETRSGHPLDRPIHLIHQPLALVNRRPAALQAEATPTSTQSESTSSSIEDVTPITVLRPSVRRTEYRPSNPSPTGRLVTISWPPAQEPRTNEVRPNQNPVEEQRRGVAEEEEEEEESSSDTQIPSSAMDGGKFNSKDMPSDRDWRSGCTGTRDLWHRLLVTELFADIWFVVGGANILSSQQTSPEMSSMDHQGAPGGPTACIQPSRPKSLNSGVKPNSTARTPPDRMGNLPSRSGSSESTVSNVICSFGSMDGCSTTNDATDLNSDADEDIVSEFSTAQRFPSRPGLPKSMSDTRLLNSEHSDLDSSVTFVESPKPTRMNPATFGVAEMNDNSSIITDGVTVGRVTTLTHRLSQPQSEHVTGANQSQMNMDAMDRLSSGEVVRIAAHRLVLATASPVFEAMFFGPVAEMNVQRMPNEYSIPDIHPEAFKIMLLYIYTDEIRMDNDLDIVFYVLYAAKKYMLPQLERRAVEHLKELITASNVCAMLERSLFFDEDNLTRRCWHVIDVLAPDVLCSVGLLRMELDNLRVLLQRETLNCTEAEVFAAVRRWAGAECVRIGMRDSVPNRAQVAGDILPLIRFPTMQLSEFAESVAYSGFLSLEMVRDLFVHITTNKAKDVKKAEYNDQVDRAENGSGERSIEQNRVIRFRTDANPNESMESISNPLSIPTSQPPSPIESKSPIFSFNPRCGPRLLRCARFTRTAKHSVSSCVLNSHQYDVTFQVSQSIFLAGIGIYGSTQIGDRLAVEVELKRCRPIHQTASGLPINSSINQFGVTSVGTQFHGNQPSPTSGVTEHSTRNRRTAAAAATAATTSAFPRSSSLLELTLYDWPRRSAMPRMPLGEMAESGNHNGTDATNGTWNVANPTGAANRGPTNEPRSVQTIQDTTPESLTSARSRIVSDGTSRVYDVRFSCPIKVDPHQRYVIHVQSTQTDRPSSISASLSSMNSATFYIGIFGRPEVRVRSGKTPTQMAPASSPHPAPMFARNSNPGIQPIPPNRHRSRHPTYTRLSRTRARDADHSSKSSSLDPSENVVFRFWEDADDSDPGEVDRGFVPELMFYLNS